MADDPDATMIARQDVLAWIRSFAASIAAEKDRLTRLDAAIGDADHGANLDRGMQAVLAKLPSAADQDVGSIFRSVGMTLVSTVGGASGPLYGTLFLKMGAATAGRVDLTLADWSTALRAGVDGVIARGKASPGEKTMVDALVPALAALDAASEDGDSIGAALSRSADAAEQGAIATIPLIARKGRASYLGERSAGHQDPGATSAALLLRAAADAVRSKP